MGFRLQGLGFRLWGLGFRVSELCLEACQDLRGRGSAAKETFIVAARALEQLEASRVEFVTRLLAPALGLCAYIVYEEEDTFMSYDSLCT
jgi:hypothetical protein